MRFRLCSIAFVVAALSGYTATSEGSKDRYGLAGQPHVYVIKRPVERSFLVESHIPLLLRGGIASSAAAATAKEEGAAVQKKLGLEDPIRYLTERLAESLRRDLGLTNLREVAEQTNIRLYPRERDKLDTAPAWQSNTPGGSASSSQDTAVKEATFRDAHPTGFVVQVVTRHWGMLDYRVKYFATARVYDLPRAKMVFAKDCPIVMLDQVDRSKLPAKGDDAEAVAIEEKLYADNGAIIKANLRKAAEQCADSIAPAFLGKS